jgi:hypothetical protein
MGNTRVHQVESQWNVEVGFNLPQVSPLRLCRAGRGQWRFPQPSATTNAHRTRPKEVFVNELIEQLKSRVGLDDQKAHSAAQTVLDFLKQRLPEPVSSQLDSVVSGGGAEGISGKIGGIFGKKTA